VTVMVRRMPPSSPDRTSPFSVTPVIDAAAPVGYVVKRNDASATVVVANWPCTSTCTVWASLRPVADDRLPAKAGLWTATMPAL